MHLLAGRYILVKQIGKGGFGAVEEYTDDITKENVAIKTIPSRYVNQESRRLVREIDIMCFVHDIHPHVIGYLSIFATKGVAVPNHNSITKGNDDPLVSVAQTAENTAVELNVLGEHYRGLGEEERLNLHHSELLSSVMKLTKTDEFNVHIVMPLMKGDLFYFIRLLSSHSSVQRLGVTHQFLAQVAVVFAFQICFGLDFLHQCAIIHRDMKPDNVLVHLDITNPYMSTALIADMGLARDAQHSDTIYICTRYYRPPEVITSVSAGSTRIDIWSLGCIFYEMCTGQTLFTMRTALNERGEWDGAKASLQLEVILNTIGTPTAADIERYMPSGNAKLYLQRSAARPSTLRQLIERNWILHTSGEEKEKWIDLITRCIAFFPEQRPTAQQLCQHQLFRDYNVFYGSNVKQCPARTYTPSCRSASDTSRTENKAAILTLVQRALRDTAPQVNEESSSADESSSGSSSMNSDSSDEEGGGTEPTRSAFLQPEVQKRVFTPSDRHSASPTGMSSETFHRIDENEECDGAAGHASVRALRTRKPLTSSSSQAPRPPLPVARYAVPLLDSSTSKEGLANTLLDDGDAEEDGEENSFDHYVEEVSCRRRAIEKGEEEEEEEEEEPTSIYQRPSMFLPRCSPGNIFRGSSLILPKRLKEHSTRTEAERRPSHRSLSEESGPIVVDTPPLGPALGFRDRITLRPPSPIESSVGPMKGAQLPSAFNLASYGIAEIGGTCPAKGLQVVESATPEGLPLAADATSADAVERLLTSYSVPIESAIQQASCYRLQPLSPSTMAGKGPYAPTSQYDLGSGMAAAAAATQNGVSPAPSLYTNAWGDANAQQSRRPQIAQNQPNGNVAIGVGQRPVAPPGTSAGSDPYSFFAGTEYDLGQATVQVAPVGGIPQLEEGQGGAPFLLGMPPSVTNERIFSQRPSTSVLAPNAESSLFCVESAPDGYQQATPQPGRRLSATPVFPSITDAELRQRYASFRHSPQSVQAATSSVLEELGRCTHDARRSSDLRELLNYFTSLQSDLLFS